MKRRLELDVCRIAACFLVVLSHISAEMFHIYPMDDRLFPAVTFLSTMPRGSVPVFFMISGALFLVRDQLEPWRFLKKNVLHLVELFFVWSLLYALGTRLAAGDFGSTYYFFYDVAAGHYHMWFIPAMTVCYLFLPVLHSALHGGGIDGRYPLFLFALIGLLLANCNLTPLPAPILHRLTQNLSLTDLNYLGYMLWGWWLSRRDYSKHWLWIGLGGYLLATVLGTAGNVWYSHFGWEADGWLFSFFSVPTFLQATFLFMAFLGLREHEFRQEGLICTLSDCTLGVYLLHPMVKSVFEKFGIAASTAHPVLTLLGLALLLTAVSFGITAIAKKIPLIKRFV